jgi:hypothetical protein
VELIIRISKRYINQGMVRFDVTVMFFAKNK